MTIRPPEHDTSSFVLRWVNLFLDLAHTAAANTTGEEAERTFLCHDIRLNSSLIYNRYRNRIEFTRVRVEKEKYYVEKNSQEFVDKG